MRLSLALPSVDVAILATLPPELSTLAAARFLPTADDPRPVLAALARGAALEWTAAEPFEASEADWPALAPAHPPETARWQVTAITDAVSRHLRGRDRVARTAFQAGLLQINDWLDESHQAAQSIEGAGDHSGDYWHAIMHRREPDYGNAKYWFRSVGGHPVARNVASRATELLCQHADTAIHTWRTRLLRDQSWDAFAFVDLCQTAARDAASPLGLVARRIQWTEMLLLLQHGWQTAVSRA